MRTQYYSATTLDGYIASTDDSLEWLFSLGDPEPSTYTEFIREIGAIAMGSATYEWLLRNAINPPGGPPTPWPYAQPTWVFTRRELPRVEGADIRFVAGDVRPVHASMAQAAAGKNIWVAGGGGLVGQFLDAGLLDDIIVQVASVVLGSGKPLLPRTIVAPPLTLQGVQMLGPRFVELRYEVQRPGPA